MSDLTPGMQAPVESHSPTRILFLCLARNCEPTLPLFFRYLSQLNHSGFLCTALIGENGSRDRSRELIHQAGPQVLWVDTSAMELAGSRLERMAFGRQLLLETARSVTPAPQFVIVADLDNVMSSPPPPEAIHRAIQRLTTDASLFAIGATSHPYFYDLLSLRSPLHDYTDLNARLTSAKSHWQTYYQFHQHSIYAEQKAVTGMLPMRCTSSFNGLCIYPASDYWRGSYRAASEADVCEHVSLNESIARTTRKNMLIDTGLSLAAPADHRPVGIITFWLDRLRKKLR